MYRGRYRRERHAGHGSGQRLIYNGGPERQVYSDPTPPGATAAPSALGRAAASTAIASTPPSAPRRAPRSRGRSRPPGVMSPTTSPRCSTPYALAASRPRSLDDWHRNSPRRAPCPRGVVAPSLSRLWLEGASTHACASAPSPVAALSPLRPGAACRRHASCVSWRRPMTQGRVYFEDSGRFANLYY